MKLLLKILLFILPIFITVGEVKSSTAVNPFHKKPWFIEIFTDNQTLTREVTGFAASFTMNTGFSLIQGESFNDALKSGKAGAVGGFGALYPEFGGWAIGGATVGATNAWLGGSTGWDIVIGAGVGMASSYAGGFAGQWGAQYLGGAIINGTNITSPVLQGAITGTIGGAVGGYTGGFTSGLIMTGNFREANSAGWKGAAFGAPIGGISGSVSAYRYAVNNDISPWTRRNIAPKTPVYDFTPDPYGDNVTLYRGTTGSEGDNTRPLFMTDNYEYAKSYVANGGQVVETTVPKSTLWMMDKTNVLSISPKPQIHIINGRSYYGIEYKFNSTVKHLIIPRFKY